MISSQTKIYVRVANIDFSSGESDVAENEENSRKYTDNKLKSVAHRKKRSVMRLPEKIHKYCNIYETRNTQKNKKKNISICIYIL